MKRQIAVMAAILFAACVGTARAQVSGSTTLTVVAATGNGLLTGATVTGSNPDCTQNGISVSVPSGWTLKCAQNFNAGSVGPHEELAFSNISTAVTYPGSSHSMVINFPVVSNCGDAQCSPGGEWILHTDSGLTCCGQDDYLSWYDYLDPSAQQWIEGYFAQILTNDNTTQAFIMDTQGPGHLTTTMSLWGQPASSASNAIDCSGTTEDSGRPQTCGFYGPPWNLNLGRWEQKELWIHWGTCSSGVPNNDGFVTFYIGGQQVYHIDKNNSADRTNPMGGNLNGCVDMTNHLRMDVGGSIPIRTQGIRRTSTSTPITLL